MKPKPLDELKNLTVPMVIAYSFLECRPDGCQEGENIKSGSVWARHARGGSGWRFFWSSREMGYAPLAGRIQGNSPCTDPFSARKLGFSQLHWRAGPYFL